MKTVVKIVDNSAKFLTASIYQINAALRAIGTQCEGHAKEELSNTPERIDTGLLRNSITFAISGAKPNIKSYSGDRPPRNSPNKEIPSGSYSGQAPDAEDGKPGVWVGTNVEYATYVHDGTQKMTPNRFIKNAVTKNRKEYKEIAIQYLKNKK